MTCDLLPVATDSACSRKGRGLIGGVGLQVRIHVDSNAEERIFYRGDTHLTFPHYVPGRANIYYNKYGLSRIQ